MPDFYQDSRIIPWENRENVKKECDINPGFTQTCNGFFPEHLTSFNQVSEKSVWLFLCNPVYTQMDNGLKKTLLGDFGPKVPNMAGGQTA